MSRVNNAFEINDNLISYDKRSEIKQTSCILTIDIFAHTVATLLFSLQKCLIPQWLNIPVRDLYILHDPHYAQRRVRYYYDKVLNQISFIVRNRLSQQLDIIVILCPPTKMPFRLLQN